jgi:hypothetical protein
LICHTFNEKWQQKESLIVNGRSKRKKFTLCVKNYSLLLQKNVPSIVGLPLSKTEEQGTNYYIQTNVQYDIFIVLFLICLQHKRRALLSHLKHTYEIYTCPKMQNTASHGKVLKSLRNYYALKRNIL